MYKATAAQVNVFGLQTQFGGGKTTGFALVYDSPDALKKFEPHYRLVRIGLANKIEKPSRQQRTSEIFTWDCEWDANLMDRQATQEQTEDTPGYGEGQGCQEEEGLVDATFSVCGRWRLLVLREWALALYASALAFHRFPGMDFTQDGMNRWNRSAYTPIKAFAFF